MADRRLYTLVVPEDSLTSTRSNITRNISAQGIVSDGVASAESISIDPGEQRVEGVYRGKFAAHRAQELEELFNASGIEAIPYFASGDAEAGAAYVTLSDIEVQRANPRLPEVQTFDGTVTELGTRRSHWRAVKTAPETIKNDFGATSEAEIGIHSRARKPRWFDDTGGGTEPATVIRTVHTSHGAVDVYDVTEPTFSTPTLIYDLPYRFEGYGDCRVYDSHNGPKFKYYRDTDPPEVGSATVGAATVSGEGQRAWQRVFATDHEFSGDPVLSNGSLRLRFHESPGVIEAERYEHAFGDYARVHLGATDWRLFDVDLTHVGLARVEAQVTFQDSTGNQYHLDLALRRGMRNALWARPVNESNAVPAGLEDRLRPIARTTDTDPSDSTTTVSREDVRR